MRYLEVKRKGKHNLRDPRKAEAGHADRRHTHGSRSASPDARKRILSVQATTTSVFAASATALMHGAEGTEATVRRCGSRRPRAWPAGAWPARPHLGHTQSDHGPRAALLAVRSEEPDAETRSPVCGIIHRGEKARSPPSVRRGTDRQANGGGYTGSRLI